MDKRYTKKPNLSTEEGPSDLTIKRILAFSKALKNSTNAVAGKEKKEQS